MTKPNLYSVIPRNSAYNAAATVWQVLVMYVLVPFIIKLAGDSHYGLWVLLSTLSVVGLFGFMDLGIVSAVVKWVADAEAKGDHERSSQVLNLSLLIYLPLSLLLGGAMLLGRDWMVGSAFDIAEEDQGLAAMMVVGFAIQLVADFIAMPLGAVAQAMLRFGWLKLLQSLKVTLFGALSLWSLQQGEGIASMPFISAGLALIYLPAMFWLARTQLPHWRLGVRAERGLMRDVVTLSANVFMLRTSGILYKVMDKYIIGAVLGTVAVKNYDIVFKVHALALMPSTFVTPLIVPVTAGLFARGNQEDLRSLLLRGSKYLAAAVVPIAVAVFMLAEPLLVHWLGPAEAENAPLVQLFVSYIFFWPMVQVGWCMLVGLNRILPLLWVSAGTVAMNLALSLLLINSHGIQGVMIATVLSNGLAALLYARLQVKEIGVSGWHFLRAVVGSSALSSSVCAAVLWGAQQLRQPASLLETLAFMGLGTAAGLLAFGLLALSADERRRLIGGVLSRGS